MSYTCTKSSRLDNFIATEVKLGSEGLVSDINNYGHSH